MTPNNKKNINPINTHTKFLTAKELVENHGKAVRSACEEAGISEATYYNHNRFFTTNIEPADAEAIRRENRLKDKLAALERDYAAKQEANEKLETTIFSMNESIAILKNKIIDLVLEKN